MKIMETVVLTNEGITLLEDAVRDLTKENEELKKEIERLKNEFEKSKYTEVEWKFIDHYKNKTREETTQCINWLTEIGWVLISARMDDPEDIGIQFVRDEENVFVDAQLTASGERISTMQILNAAFDKLDYIRFGKIAKVLEEGLG